MASQIDVGICVRWFYDRFTNCNVAEWVVKICAGIVSRPVWMKVNFLIEPFAPSEVKLMISKSLFLSLGQFKIEITLSVFGS